MKHCPVCGHNYGGIERINGREYCCSPNHQYGRRHELMKDKEVDWGATIPIIERALGFELHQWQREYLITGAYNKFGRVSGRTTAYCIKLALTYQGGPIRIKDIDRLHDGEYGTQYHRWFNRFFLSIWECLKDAGLPVMEIRREV